MIYTSYFGMVKTLEKNGIEPIAISQGVPKNWTGRRIKSLAPTWAMLKMSDEDYDRAYEKILQKNDVRAIIEMFNGKDVALLCWEKDVNDCHRKKVGEWLSSYGYDVQEYGTEPKKPKPKKADKTLKDEPCEQQMSLFDIFPSLA